MLWVSVISALYQWLGRWLCLHWKALYMSTSQWILEVLWSVLSVIQDRLWRFPFPLSASRRWDHRTSLHRWQPRLKVSRSGGAYRLLARCEILPRMLFLLEPDPLLPGEMGCHCFRPEAEKKRLQLGVLLSSYYFPACFLPMREYMSTPTRICVCFKAWENLLVFALNMGTLI